MLIFLEHVSKVKGENKSGPGIDMLELVLIGYWDSFGSKEVKVYINCFFLFYVDKNLLSSLFLGHPYGKWL